MSSAVDRRTKPATAVLTATRRLVLAEQLGLPVEAAEAAEAAEEVAIHALRTRSGRELLWAGEHLLGEGPVAATIQGARVSIPIFARVAGDRASEPHLVSRGGDWSCVVPLRGSDGGHVASIWVSREGEVFLPFDPDEVCEAYWSERYREAVAGPVGSSARRVAVWSYYRLRRLLPRAVQIWLRRRYAHIQARTAFPHWPVETALHDFFDLFGAILTDVDGEPVPHLAPWPDDHTWALVLTHDVETTAGLDVLPRIAELERRLGLRSAWNFVPRRYDTSETLLAELVSDGFEVGVHGLYHDGRDLESVERVRERGPAMREAAERWGAVGFRAPATQRGWELMPMLGFDYDSSYPDTDPFEPQGGGCCTWLPYFNRELVELPLTMPQDHTIFVVLRRGEEPWTTKASFLRDQGGMALLDTHPDYLADADMSAAYERLLERFAADPRAWKALPREVSSWWRRRAASRVIAGDDGWTVEGPAAGEASVELTKGAAWR